MNINCVVTTNQIPNEKYEYILCTSYLSPEDFHSVYIEKKVEETGLLHCINSWGPDNKPHPVILIGDHSNEFYRVQMTIIPKEEPDFKQAVLDQNSVSKYNQTADFWKQLNNHAIDSNLFQLSNAKSLQCSDSIGNKGSVNRRLEVLEETIKKLPEMVKKIMEK